MMAVEKKHMMVSDVMYFGRFCLYFCPRFCSKTQWKLAWTDSWSSWIRIYWKCHVNCEGILIVAVEKAINDQCNIYILTDFAFIFLSNSTVKPCETWHGQSHGHFKEESIGNLMSTQKACRYWYCRLLILEFWMNPIFNFFTKSTVKYLQMQYNCIL